MKIIYCLPPAGLGGGPRVIAEHVTRLRERGHDASVWTTGGSFDWFNYPVPRLVFPSVESLETHLQAVPSIKVATTPETARWVARASTKLSKQGFYFIQDEDEKTYSGIEEGESYRLGLTPIFEGQYVQDLIEKKYGIRGHNVGIGIDHKMFFNMNRPRERYRVLTPCRRDSGGPNNLKGWDTAEATLRELAKIEQQASVVTFSMEDSPKIDWMPHIHVKHPTDSHLAHLYNESGVFLSCSRHEGFGLPMLEAMACGLPVVCTDANGNREFCRNLTERDPELLAVKIRLIMKMESLSHHESKYGVHVASQYRWEPVIDNLVRLFSRQQ